VLSLYEWWKRVYETAERFRRDLDLGNLALYATSLIYTSILSCVPLLAFAFSVLKAFGVHTRLESLLTAFFSPLGPQSEQLVIQMVGFVNQLKVGVLGSVGLAFLLYGVVALISKVERAFNMIWQIEQSRKLTRKFSDYLSVLLVGPLLVVSAMGLSGTILNNNIIQQIIAIGPTSSAISIGGQFLPFFLISLTFAFIYAYLPNTRVRWRPALLSGVIAAVLWKIVGFIFAQFIVSSTRLDAIYSSFAVAILGLNWLYANWMVLLIGAKICFYLQNSEYLSARNSAHSFTSGMQEGLALAVVHLIGERFYSAEPAYNIQEIALKLRVPVTWVHQTIEILIKAGFVLMTESGLCLPARSLATIRIYDVLARTRFGIDGQKDGCALPQATCEVMEKLERLRAEAIGGQNILAWITEGNNSDHKKSYSGTELKNL